MFATFPKSPLAIAVRNVVFWRKAADPVTPDGGEMTGVVGSHSLIPDVLFHAFATFGVLMSPVLPLSRRQQEKITTVVSVTNRCVY